MREKAKRTPSEVGRARILQFLDHCWGNSTKQMAETFEVSPESLSTYLNYMKKDDLIYHLTRGQWALTKRGERVLEDFKRSRGEKGNE